MRDRLGWLRPADDERYRDWARRLAPYAAVVVVLAVLLAGVGAWVYFDYLAYGPTEPPSAVESEYAVTVESGYGGYVIRPDDQPPAGDRVGLVFYPGGRVEPGSYVHTLAPLAERGVTIVVPGMPLNLAVLDSDAAHAPIASEDGVDAWYVGGHSLGGAMACRYANGNTDRVDGLVLAASYCDVNVSDSGLATVAITGSRDGVLNRERFESNRRFLPTDATFVSVQGMNHGQFGSYGRQEGDGEATISTATAHERVVAALVDWLCAEGESVGCANQTGGRFAGSS
ncbi:alpha/beta hydrolase [Haloarchaeobius iranensis]|uniref:Alpha/beta hydrolase family protein n=1 Tax=Haloarchaeobius iranensis TaxID=996166 RepID=A0A1G9SIU2_9EURY|nr:alpha/beta hydrolase [Haloarchaeobius iranensis]SDM35217.1 Alpha/beta hydrolase family protein [Haloarchaeobius iranensis]